MEEGEELKKITITKNVIRSKLLELWPDRFPGRFHPTFLKNELWHH